jgi:hypothetical protein
VGPTGRRRRSSAAAASSKLAWNEAFFDIGFTSSSSSEDEGQGDKGQPGAKKQAGGKKGAKGKKRRKAASDSESGSDWAADAGSGESFADVRFHFTASSAP